MFELHYFEILLNKIIQLDENNSVEINVGHFMGIFPEILDSMLNIPLINKAKIWKYNATLTNFTWKFATNCPWTWKFASNCSFYIRKIRKSKYFVFY